ncbi:hypothetical protein EDC39_11549 [Geothermobacter ehrlichii]|uniref:Porin n=1 Tax=Geothermobacter ehrlichii TaxID=213224 RepID=A0A5D3WHE7_9BACT|nr:hypothetical protein [Geothermobacter ehrlichii]TYO96103.1 hypothetical protein EDC39_11549 [Geothermobacter ehrlichii]
MSVRCCLAKAAPLCALVLLLFVPGPAQAVELRIQSDTIVRGFERDPGTGTDEAVIPGYEYLQADVGSLSEAGLSFHFYGWGRADLADNGFYSDTTAGEILYGYLQYRDSATGLQARLGRQYLFAGVSNEAVDGLSLAADLGPLFFLSLYGGQPVGLDSTGGRDGDSIYGGRLAVHVADWGDVGFSYKNIDNDSDTAEQMAGIDLSLYLPGGISLFGNSVRNLETDGWAEHSWELQYDMGAWRLRPLVSMFEYSDYFGTGANAVNPFRFLAASGEKITVYGADLTRRGEVWTLGGKVRAYSYDQAGDNAYYAVLASWHGEEDTELGGELGFMDGDTDRQGYGQARLYAYVGGLRGRCWVDFVSGDLVYYWYDQSIYGEDASFFVSFGTGRTFLDGALQLKVSGDYSSDPYFDDDVRGLFTLTYAYDHGQ